LIYFIQINFLFNKIYFIISQIDTTYPSFLFLINLEFLLTSSLSIHPYQIYIQTIFGIIGETLSVIFRYYFNLTDYYPTSNPTPVLTHLGDGGWVIVL
jgi:hypothetical protein